MLNVAEEELISRELAQRLHRLQEYGNFLRMLFRMLLPRKRKPDWLTIVILTSGLMAICICH